MAFLHLSFGIFLFRNFDVFELHNLFISVKYVYLCIFITKKVHTDQSAICYIMPFLQKLIDANIPKK